MTPSPLADQLGEVGKRPEPFDIIEGAQPPLRPLHLVVRETEFCGLRLGGLFQAQNAGEQSEFGSQTTLRLTNPPELRGFLPARKPRRFACTAWWGM